MAYRIQYDRVGKRGIFSGKGPWLIALVVCVLLVFAYVHSQSDAPKLQKDDATTKAFHVLMEDLREGTALPHALEVFCQSVLEGANVQK